MIEISQHRYRTVSWGHHREQSKRSRSPRWGQRQPAEAGMNRKRGRRGCKPRSAARKELRSERRCGWHLPLNAGGQGKLSGGSANESGYEGEMGVNEAKAKQRVRGPGRVRRPSPWAWRKDCGRPGGGERGLHGEPRPLDAAAGRAAGGLCRVAGIARVRPLGLPTPSLPLPSRSPTKPPSFPGFPQSLLPGA